MAGVGALALAAWAGTALAQVHRPAGSGRLQKQWSFEERATDLEPVPRNWFRSIHDPDRGVNRPGFPRFNQAELVNTVSFDGDWSLMLPTRGGSTSIMLARGVVPTIPDGDLLITAMVRTDDLERARGRIVARFLDRSLNVVPQGTFSSDLILTDGSWQLVPVRMEGNPDAAWLQIELQLLQPDRFGIGARHAMEMVREDIRGAVYFDDLRVYQMPRIAVTTGTPGNVVIAPRVPEVELRVFDVAGDRLDAHLRIVDAMGHIVDETVREVGASGGTIRWVPALRELGWYMVDVSLVNPEGTVAEHTGALAWVAKPRVIDRVDASRFGVHVDEAGGRTEDFGAVLDAVGVGRVWMDVWARTEAERALSFDASLESADRIDRLVESLLDSGLEVGFVLEETPPDLARSSQLDPEQVLDALSRDASMWMPGLQGLLARFGERVSSWQVGVDDPDTWRATPQTVAMAGRVRDAFGTLIPRPFVTLPWPIERPLGAMVPGVGVMVDLTTRTPPEGIGLYAAHWRLAGAEMPGAMIGTLDPTAFGSCAMVSDLARRVILAWSEGINPIGIERPWTPRSAREGGSLPAVSLVIMRTIVEELAGRDAVGELPVGPGVRAIIAGPRRGAGRTGPGVLIAWNKGGEDSPGISGYLGSGAIVVRDLFGNERSLGTGSVGEIALGDRPVFIEGIDTELMLFRAGLRVDPEFIETRSQRHELDLVVPNPWNTPIHGELRLRDPESWEFRPRTIVFAVPAHSEQRIPIDIAFGANEPTGPRDLRAEVALSAESRYPIQEIAIPVELGLSTVGVWATYRLVDGAGGPESDLEVTMLVTNRGTDSSSYTAVAVAPNAPDKEAVISSLAPGEAAVRRFRFDGGGTALRGQRIRVGLIEREGTGRINIGIDVR